MVSTDLKQVDSIDTKDAELKLNRLNYRCDIQDECVIVQDPIFLNGVIQAHHEVMLFTNGDLRRFFSARI